MQTQTTYNDNRPQNILNTVAVPCGVQFGTYKAQSDNSQPNAESQVLNRNVCESFAETEPFNVAAL